ncbi:S41 family peptidase [Shewanella youngdeokensis]|uniref:S41 family peptidase n=1 Tax=Shewanella youngdeokensis TaxID=2999068 RepID=A0ABZ0JX09_9GAMM|nr:S41 family peptidase [Shewanella sp. DAU334]
MLNSKKFITLILTTSFALTACGGGSNDNKAGTPATGNSGGNPAMVWVQGQFTPYLELAGQCSANQTGTTLIEKLWMRSWSNDTYLWYDEIIDRDPAPYSVSEYFDLLITNELSDSGNAKDVFHFSMPTDEWEQLNQSGASVGYGFNFQLINRDQNIERNVTVTYNEPGTPAATANIDRGAVIVEIDGVSVQNANDSTSIDILNAGLFPSETGKQTVFTIRDLGATADRDVTLTAQTIVSTPVQNIKTLQTTDGTVGYLQFNAHIATAERGLFDAFTTLSQAGVDDLILDVRYNGGGLLAMASQLSYMIAGETATANRTFESTRFNDKYPTKDPVTHETLTPMPFIDETLGFNSGLLAAGSALPTLDLERVYVLTTAGTCSASESIMNSLRGVDIEVIQIGGTTCGKPYGFYPTPNCDTTYFTIQFQGINDKGFGDYSDGLFPSSSPTLASEIPGCMLDDDLFHALGDTDERLLSAALYYRTNARCPATVASMAKVAATSEFIDDGYILKDPRNQTVIKNNRIITDIKGAL